MTSPERYPSSPPKRLLPRRAHRVLVAELNLTISLLSGAIEIGISLNERHRAKWGPSTVARLIAAGMRPTPEFRPVLPAALDSQEIVEVDDGSGPSV